jgi:carbamoyl-phosphate synthase small subunit
MAGGGGGRAARRSGAGMKAVLALADGTVFEGTSFGAAGEAGGEVVFNTSMTGYQEILTDPSYRGQLVAMTYPEIGNVGVNPEDVESGRPFVGGFIVKEYWARPSNWRAQQSLAEYLTVNGIPGIQGIDTRALVRHIRTHGAQEALISTTDLDPKRVAEKARALPSLIGRDLVKEVTCSIPYSWDESTWSLVGGYSRRATNHAPQAFVVAYDFGIKRNILRNLVRSGCRVRVVPAATPAAETLAMNPNGIFLSNGPGDPDVGPYAGIVRDLIGKKPIFGICLGHQIMGLALGGKTYKLKFGHHGGNQPVMDLTTRKVEITAQNHGFAVDVDSLKGIAQLTHVNLNDQTVEGLAHAELPMFSVQYHPEASPGPSDANYLFARFMRLMEGAQ